MGKTKIGYQHLLLESAMLPAMFSFGAATSFADWSALPALAVFFGLTTINLLMWGFRHLNAKEW